jgi:acetyl esterase/lipase
MEIIKLIIQILAAVLGSLAALMSIPIFLRFQWPSPFSWLLKLFASALSHILFIVGLFSIIVGIATASVFISLVGLYVTVFFLIHIYRVTRPPDVASGFEKAFGVDWESGITAEQKKYFLPTRATIKLPTVPTPRFEQNISFVTIPGTDRKLLCDVWQPNERVTPSGLAFIYLHGSAWALLDKDFVTRTFFKQLAAQGHVVMDVAYRLAHETDIMGMVQDVKRAIVWMKENANRYGVNPNKIVVGGGSAGGHLALLAAYTANKPQFTPNELDGKKVSACAVVSLYGLAELKLMYYHTNQNLLPRPSSSSEKKAAPMQFPKWLIKVMGKSYYRFHFDKDFANVGVFAILLGGDPNECPEQYALYSPVTHVSSQCPPTLLLHGDHDILVPVNATRILHTRLVEEKVQTVMHILPQTDHGFDLMLPKISPSAHNAMYDVERFLALQIKNT